MEPLEKEIIEATKTSFIHNQIESKEELRPRLLCNNRFQGNTVLADLERELKYCESFWFSVAFITNSGLIMLKNILKELENKGVKGKILTTDYLEFNQPQALRDLLKFLWCQRCDYSKRA